MRKGRALAAAAAVIGSAMVAIAVPRIWSSRVARAPHGAACPADAKPANFNFTLKDLDGRNVRLDDYKGKVILLDFWATWCGPCKVEIPGFIDLYNKYKTQGFEVVSVVLLDKFANAGPYAQAMKMNYPVLNGDEQQDAIDDAYGPLFGLPMSFLIGRDGRICQKHLGLPSATATKDPDAKTVKDIFEAEIKSLL
ncbi:MAG TPA: TlpA disulfide reductase family protein [Vicinamibacterales bacterium]